MEIKSRRDVYKNVVTVLFISAMTLCSSQSTTAATPKSNDTNPSVMLSKINRTVDPDYVYPYQKSKFVPKEGRSLLMMGQTVEAIDEYLEAFPEQPLPGGWASYWGITEFEGVKDNFKNETGSTQNHQMLVDQFPNAVIHSAMWMVGTWNITENAGFGFYDKVLLKYAKWAKKINRPIYLRIGYEFDGAHNELDPKQYITAYKHIVDLFRKEGVNNIAYVWHSYAAPTYKGHPIENWYPGDDYVDWVGISVFGQAYGGTNFGKDTDRVLQFAKAHYKPIMIAESNPIHGISENDTQSWDTWFVPFFNFIYQKNIKAVSFINEDWQRLNIPGISDWQDGRLYNNPLISQAWFQETNRDYFMKSSPSLFNELGYSKK